MKNVLVVAIVTLLVLAGCSAEKLVGPQEAPVPNMDPTTDLAGKKAPVSPVKLTVVPRSLPTTVLNNGKWAIYEVAVIAHEKGDVGVSRFEFQFEATPELTLTNFVLFEPSFGAYLPATVSVSGGVVKITLDYPVMIPAGAIKEFQLRATISGLATDSYLSTQITGVKLEKRKENKFVAGLPGPEQTLYR